MSKYAKSANFYIGYLSQSLAKSGSETEIYVSSLQTLTGETISTADFSTLGMGELTIDPLTSSTIESCTFTGIGSLSFTGVTRGLSAVGDDVSASRKPYHPVGTLCIITFGVHSMNSFYTSLAPYKYWALPVANYAALPAGAQDGETRVTQDDSKIYVWDSGTTTWNLAGAGGGAGTVYVTTKLGSESDGGDLKTFSLTSGSFPDNKYLSVFVNGILMEYGASADYLTSGGNKAIFNNVVLATDKITLLVTSVDIVNPDWNNMTADLLPTLDNTYNIGDLTHRIKDLFLYNTSSGTPTSTTNKVIDQADATTTKTANKIARRDANGDVLVSTTPTSGDAACSKTYVGEGSYRLFKNGITTHDVSVTGTQTIAHGLGRVPLKVKLSTVCPTSILHAFSISTYNGTTVSTVWSAGTQNNGAGADASNWVILSGLAGNNAHSASATGTVDATNITLTWSKSNSPTGTAGLMWEVE